MVTVYAEYHLFRLSLKVQDGIKVNHFTARPTTRTKTGNHLLPFSNTRYH